MAETYASQFIVDFNQQVSGFGLKIDCFSRRLMDICVSAAGLLFLSPLFLLFGLLIKHDSPGPVFYHGRRVGKDGKEFKILKFRTMYETLASHAGPSITCDGDARITPFGAWLRETKVNELPQLWNVLVGQMSLVGPRPEDPDIALEWPEQVRRDLLSVRPGITSPASIVYRDEEKLLSSMNLLRGYFQDILPSKLRLDQLYLKKRTFLSDLDVIFLTALALLPIVRKRALPQYLLYWGPIARLTSRFGIWLLLDWMVALASIGVAGLYWRTLGPLELGLPQAVAISIAFALLFSLTNLTIGLNNTAWSKAGASEGIWVVFSAGVGTLLLVALDRVVFGRHFFPTGMILFAGFLATIGFGIVRYRERLITSFASRWIGTRQARKMVGERVLIVGAGDMGRWAIWLFSHGDFAGAFSIAGMVDDDPRKIGMEANGVKILATSENIPELVKKLDIGIVVFAIAQIDLPERERILKQVRNLDLKLVLFPDVMELLRSSMMPEEEAILAAADRNEHNGVLERVQKEEVSSWMNEMDALLAAHDVYGARALLADMKVHYNT
jgi:lipopolysaccharide/colanic/teichoic acid biosynthesis glycosyltransferase